MSNSISNLIDKFNEIRNMGFIPSINYDCSGVGLTFEKLIGKEPDFLPLPDLYPFEIKTKLYNSKTPIHLFCLSPKGNHDKEILRLWEKYGHPGIKNRNVKMLNNDAFANILTPVGKLYYFLLSVNYSQKRIELHIYNKFKVMIDCSTFWSFEDVEIALNRKLKYLALVKALQNNKKRIRYYKYYRIDIYRLKTFKDFIMLIETGKIKVKFSVSSYYGPDELLKIRDRGTSFDIDEKYIEELFEKIY